MTAPRVLVVLKTDLAWSRGILRGFITAAHEHGWVLLHYDSPAYLSWLADAMAPIRAAVATGFDAPEFGKLESATQVSINVDRTAENIASVYLDEAAIAGMAYEHLHATGLRNVSTFRYDESPFAIARERAFVASARARGARVAPGWGSGDVDPRERYENPAAMLAWLHALPKPCGIFTCADSWGRTVARYAQLGGYRVPEDLALVGVDNDVLECELVSPPLSSVMVPWVEVGRNAAGLVHSALSGKSIAGARIVIQPLSVIARRSTELLAVDDPLVARAVAWIRENAARRISVPMLARAVASGRHRLERAFRRALGRTIQEEIQRARVEAAKRSLETSRVGLAEIGRQCGFKTASLFSVVFQRELGMTPGVYRRRVQQELAGTDRS